MFLGKGKIAADGGEVARASFGDAGGGAGGRIAAHYESTRFAGKFSAHGGASRSEAGGPGTVYLSQNKTHKTLIIDNNGYRASKLYISNYRDISNDGGRAWLLAEHMDEFTINLLHLRGGSHFAIYHLRPTFTLNIERLEGDLGGFIHVSKKNRVYINNAPRLFPASFHIYNEGFLHLPRDVLLKDLFYPRISLEGLISGMDNLTIGGGAEFVVTDQVLLSLNFKKPSQTACQTVRPSIVHLPVSQVVSLLSCQSVRCSKVCSVSCFISQYRSLR